MEIRGTIGDYFNICSDGCSFNINNAYGSVCDESVMANIANANSQIEDIKNLQFHNYDHTVFNTRYLGLIANEVMNVSPGLVKTTSDGCKTIAYSILYLKGIKALQEIIEKVEKLEANVAILQSYH